MHVRTSARVAEPHRTVGATRGTNLLRREPNMHIGPVSWTRPEEIVGARCKAWDLETNTKIASEARRSIIRRGGGGTPTTWFQVTGMAAQSVALRNAIFRVIPRALVDVIVCRGEGRGGRQRPRHSWPGARDRRASPEGRHSRPSASWRASKTTVEDIGLEGALRDPGRPVVVPVLRAGSHFRRGVPAGGWWRDGQDRRNFPRSPRQ